jgi:ADP-heptose:LPS heptosyltransferase
MQTVSGGQQSPAAARVALCIADFPNLGDHLALLPLYHGLRGRFPGARLLLASRYPLAELARTYGFVDEVLLYRRANRALLAAVRGFHPDITICLRRSSFGTRLCFGRASGAGLTAGVEGPGGRWLFSRRIPYLESVYRPYRHLAALEALGGHGSLTCTVRALAVSGTWIGPPSDYGVLVPGGMLEEKQWGPERYARVAAQLSAQHPALRWYAVIGSREAERGYATALRSELPAAEVMVEPALPDLARIFLGARLVLANDCGPGNLAQMAGAPIVLVFGNWDGGVEERIGWWFDRRPGAICLTTAGAAPISAVPEAAVRDAARALLDDPPAGAGVRRVAG